MLDPDLPLPSLPQACARRDQLLHFLNVELPKMRDELNQLLGYIAAKQDVRSNGKVEEPVEVE